VFGRYQYYIEHGIDTVHVPPMNQEWFSKILALLPDHLRVKQDKIYALSKEVEVSIPGVSDR
jgi:hypothetical protein